MVTPQDRNAIFITNLHPQPKARSRTSRRVIWYPQSLECENCTLPGKPHFFLHRYYQDKALLIKQTGITFVEYIDGCIYAIQTPDLSEKKKWLAPGNDRQFSLQTFGAQYCAVSKLCKELNYSHLKIIS